MSNRTSHAAAADTGPVERERERELGRERERDICEKQMQVKKYFLCV